MALSSVIVTMNTQRITDDSSSPAQAPGGARLAFGGSTAWGRTETQISQTAYVAFLLLVFVGLSPFATPVTSPGADALGSGAGDAMRQISYLAVFGVIAGMAVLHRGWRALAAIPLSFAILLGWCLLSSAWSLEPAVTLRRAVLVSIVATSAMLAVNTIGPARSLELLRYVLAGVVLVCWISLPLIAQSRHLASDVEQGVAGDWRGLYAHKNIAGAVCADAAIAFLYFALRFRRLVDWALCLAALGFLIGTNSKSSLGLLPLALLAGAVYRFGTKSASNRQIAAIATACLAATAAGSMFVWWGPLVQMLQDPTQFTGRVAIWQAEFAFIRDHPLLGSGYGTFAYTGESSPIYQYISAAWVGTVANGHHGYLELFVTLGIPGFVLAMLALFARPAVWFAERSNLDAGFRGLLFTIFAFFLMHNFVETNFLNTDGAEWVTFLLAIAMLKTARMDLKPLLC